MLRPDRYTNCVAALAFTLWLSGCDSEKSDRNADAIPDDFVRDVVIESPVANEQSASGKTRLTATVFLPDNHPSGEPYPLIVHSHGWGDSRISHDDAETLLAAGDSDDVYIQIASLVPQLRQAGFAVISFDQRGFGRGDDGDHGSEGGSHGMSPHFEIKDAKAVIDWATTNLNLLEDAPGDPRVGLIGGSYGGAFQLMLAAEDSRVDAIVPATTWHSLAQSLAPNGVLKKAWLLTICLVAERDHAELSMQIASACDEVTTPSSRELGDTPVAENLFFRNGLSHYTDRPGFTMPAVNALIVQGNRDTLFNQNEADALFRELGTGGGAVHLLMNESGHSLRELRHGPGSQGPQGMPYCGSIAIGEAMTNWLQARLMDKPDPGLPPICLALDNEQAIPLSSIPRGKEQYRVTFAGAMVNGSSENNDRSAADEALFFPLPGSPIAEPGLVVAGIPVARLTVTAATSNSDPTPTTGPNAAGVFVGIGIRRNNQLFLVDDQVQPLLSTDMRTGLLPQAVELVGVGEALEVGDEVGVLLFGRHDLYENHLYDGPEAGSNWLNNEAVVSGSVDLPIFRPAAIDRR